MLSDVLKVFDTTAEQGLGKEITKRYDEQISNSLDPKAASERVTKDIQVLGASAAIRAKVGLKPMGVLADGLQSILGVVRKGKKDLQAASVANLLTEYTNVTTAKIPAAPPFEVPKVTIPPIEEDVALFGIISVPIDWQLEGQMKEQLSALLNRLRDEIRNLALLPTKLIGIAEEAAKQILIGKLTLIEEFLLLSLEGFHFGFEYAVATPDWQTLFAAVAL